MNYISPSLIAKTAVTAAVLFTSAFPYAHAAQTQQAHHKHTHQVKPQLPVNIGAPLPGSANHIAPIMAEDTHSTQINDTSQQSVNQYTSEQQTSSQQAVTNPESSTNQETNNQQSVTDPESLTDQQTNDQQSYDRQTVTDSSTSQETNNQQAQTADPSTTETVTQVKPTYVSLESSSSELSHLPDAGEHKSNYLPLLAALILLAGAAIMLFTRKQMQDKK